MGPPDLRALRSLLGQLNDLKRVRAAGRPGSLAQRGFVRAWAELVAGEGAAGVARREAAAAVAAAGLAGVDAAVLLRCGLSAGEAAAALGRAVDGAAGMPPALRGELRRALPELVGRAARPAPVEVPGFVAMLAWQPRAGATRPGHPRLILEPAENHAEHCYLVAVTAVLVAPAFGADPAVPFLAGLSHHLHNAVLPDAGFAGEELLGEHLAPAMERLTAEALAELPPALAAAVTAARGVLGHADTPEARAFHAADVLDRVLQMAQYERVASFRLRHALEDLELIHPGPLQAFGNEVLVAAGLLP